MTDRLIGWIVYVVVSIGGAAALGLTRSLSFWCGGVIGWAFCEALVDLIEEANDR